MEATGCALRGLPDTALCVSLSLKRPEPGLEYVTMICRGPRVAFSASRAARPRVVTQARAVTRLERGTGSGAHATCVTGERVRRRGGEARTRGSNAHARLPALRVQGCGVRDERQGNLLEGGDALNSRNLVVREDEGVDLLERLEPRHGFDHVVVCNQRLHRPYFAQGLQRLHLACSAASRNRGTGSRIRARGVEIGSRGVEIGARE
jgi:hypothetical protein